MTTVSLTEAKSQLSAIIDRVEAGEEVTITRRGRPVVKITAVQIPAHVPKRPISEMLDELAAFRATMPRWRKSSAKIVREMRDENY